MIEHAVAVGIECSVALRHVGHAVVVIVNVDLIEDPITVRVERDVRVQVVWGAVAVVVVVGGIAVAVRVLGPGRGHTVAVVVLVAPVADPVPIRVLKRRVRPGVAAGTDSVLVGVVEPVRVGIRPRRHRVGEPVVVRVVPLGGVRHVVVVGVEVEVVGEGVAVGVGQLDRGAAAVRVVRVVEPVAVGVDSRGRDVGALDLRLDVVDDAVAVRVDVVVVRESVAVGVDGSAALLDVGDPVAVAVCVHDDDNRLSEEALAGAPVGDDERDRARRVAGRNGSRVLRGGGVRIREVAAAVAAPFVAVARVASADDGGERHGLPGTDPGRNRRFDLEATVDAGQEHEVQKRPLSGDVLRVRVLVEFLSSLVHDQARARIAEAAAPGDRGGRARGETWDVGMARVVDGDDGRRPPPAFERKVDPLGAVVGRLVEGRNELHDRVGPRRVVVREGRIGVRVVVLVDESSDGEEVHVGIAVGITRIVEYLHLARGVGRRPEVHALVHAGEDHAVVVPVGMRLREGEEIVAGGQVLRPLDPVVADRDLGVVEVVRDDLGPVVVQNGDGTRREDLVDGYALDVLRGVLADDTGAFPHLDGCLDRAVDEIARDDEGSACEVPEVRGAAVDLARVDHPPHRDVMVQDEIVDEAVGLEPVLGGLGLLPHVDHV